jgi:GrpB-like predicted nucleotidyltransferase (UPF0157 family)
VTEQPSAARSRPVIIVAYRPEWGAQFTSIGRDIRRQVGDAALRIDHIGSTAVAGLGAKNVIDVQITVPSLGNADAVVQPLRTAGFRQGEAFVSDEFAGLPPNGPELRKRYMREPEGQRRVHIHIREAKRFNQRFPLLSRDYLRAAPAVRRSYEELKRHAAQIYPRDIDGYLRFKEPVFRLIHEASELWAQATGWQPDGDHS